MGFHSVILWLISLVGWLAGICCLLDIPYKQCKEKSGQYTFSMTLYLPELNPKGHIREMAKNPFHTGVSSVSALEI